VNVHEVKPVQLINHCALYCGSSLAVLNPSVHSAALRGGCCVPPYVLDVCAVLTARFVCSYNKRRLLLLLLTSTRFIGYTGK